MKRLFTRKFDKVIDGRNFVVEIAKLGTVEFSAIRKTYSESLMRCPRNKIVEMNQAIKEKNNDKLLELKDELGIEVFNDIEKFTHETIKASIINIWVDSIQYTPEEVFPQLPNDELEWVSSCFAEMNMDLFNSKKK